MGFSKKQRRLRKKLLAVTILLTGILMLSAWLMKNRVEPHLEEIGRLRANVMVSQIVNKALNEQFYVQDGMDSLLVRETDETGRTEIVQANTQAMNLLITEISKELQKQYAERPQDIYAVPLGTLLGDKFLSQTKPSVDIRIIPISVSSIDFKTEFASEGINQTKYKVYIDLRSSVKVIAPLVSDTFEVSTTVLIAEAVILGTVPDSYVYVPEEDILDVTSE
ncbi:MAG: sporulation protein YunB [Firmicutes bacterium]|nr:sporulation protein YunB [Bacillota bacterium]